MKNTASFKARSNPVARQAGVVLPVALFVLVAATLLALAFVRANLITLRVGGASVIAAEAQAIAEMNQNTFLLANRLDNPQESPFHLPFGGLAGVFAVFATNDSAPGENPVRNTVVSSVFCTKNAPPSEKPSQFGGSGGMQKALLAFNAHQVRSSVDDSAFGSHAEVNTGVTTMVADSGCPLPK